MVPPEPRLAGAVVRALAAMLVFEKAVACTWALPAWVAALHNRLAPDRQQRPENVFGADSCCVALLKSNDLPNACLTTTGLPPVIRFCVLTYRKNVEV